jgi:hypothetical protein
VRSAELEAFQRDAARHKAAGDAALARANALATETVERTAVLDKREDDLARLDRTMHEQRVCLARDTRAAHDAANGMHGELDSNSLPRTTREARAPHTPPLLTAESTVNRTRTALNATDLGSGARAVAAGASTSRGGVGSGGASVEVPERVREKIFAWTSQLDDHDAAARREVNRYSISAR